MFRFIVCPVLFPTAPVGELELSAVSWNDSTTGTGSTLTGKVEIAPYQDKAKVLALTEPNTMALYVLDTDTGQYLFGGVIKKRPWSISERRLTLTVLSWKGWLYQKLLTMNRLVNPITDTLWNFTNTDQFVIARNMFTSTSPKGILADVGVPPINMGTELSGVMRDLSWQGSQFKFAGELIDSMATRDQGFDWDIRVEPDNVTSWPKLWFRPYFPGRGVLNNQVMLFHSATQAGGNILAIDDPEDSSDEMRTRVWATGSGTPPDQIVAFDEDPDLSSDLVLLCTETVSNFSTVEDVATLASHARATRKYYGQPLRTAVITCGLTDPDYRTYDSGDKIRLLVQDSWLDWDFTAVRIIDREFNILNQGGGAAPDTMKVTIDLNDNQLPEDEASL